jgi:hypothetical protein
MHSKIKSNLTIFTMNILMNNDFSDVYQHKQQINVPI